MLDGHHPINLTRLWPVINHLSQGIPGGRVQRVTATSRLRLTVVRISMIVITSRIIA